MKQNRNRSRTFFRHMDLLWRQESGQILRLCRASKMATGGEVSGVGQSDGFFWLTSGSGGVKNSPRLVFSVCAGSLTIDQKASIFLRSHLKRYKALSHVLRHGVRNIQNVWACSLDAMYNSHQRIWSKIGNRSRTLFRHIDFLWRHEGGQILRFCRASKMATWGRGRVSDRNEYFWTTSCRKQVLKCSSAHELCVWWYDCQEQWATYTKAKTLLIWTMDVLSLRDLL